MSCRKKVERVAVGKLYVEEEKVGVGMRGKPLGSFFHTAGNYVVSHSGRRRAIRNAAGGQQESRLQ